MTKTKKKTSKQKRVLVASIVLAGLIVAGGTFAWFTSTDTVTNKLTASNNYGVSIVEDFTPPTDWTPGEEVNKDVKVTNTGNVDAFVKVSLSNTLDLTTAAGGGEYSAENTDKYVELSYTANAGSLPDTQPTSADEVKAVQAGGRVVCIAGNKVTTELEEIKDGTDFEPTDTGLYVFEKSSTVEGGTRKYVYDGYYFVEGAEGSSNVYYDITEIEAADNDAGFTYKMMEKTSEVGKEPTLNYTALTGTPTGDTITATYGEGKSKIQVNIVLKDGWEDEWYFDSEDSTFYYKNTLKAGATTTNQLIDKIELDDSVSNEAYQSFDYNLNVVADSVQVVTAEDGKQIAQAVTAQWSKTPTLSYDASGKVINSVTWAART